jgi:tetratricopeptide (TPR) repeat protein
MRRILPFLICLAPALSFCQSKKELIETAIMQSLRKEYILDSINKCIMAENVQLQAVKNSNALEMPQRDSLQVLLKTKKASLDQLTKELEFLSNDLKSELKRIQGFRTNLDKLSTYIKFVKESCFNVYETDETEAFLKAFAYFEKEIELLTPKAIAEDSTQAKNILYFYYFELEDKDPSFIYKALEYAAPGTQEAKCLKEICSEISDLIDKLIEEDAWSGTIDAKRNEFLSYSRRLEASYAKDESFLNVFHLYDLVNVLEGLKQYELALSYSNLLLKSCPTKDIRYYHYSQRSELYIELNKLELALKDSETSISSYKKSKYDPKNLYFRELAKCKILMGLDRFNEANTLCDKMISDLSSKEQSNKFMSNKKSWILSKKVVCLYEMGRIAQADTLFDFLMEYYNCDELIFSCGNELYEPCVYHDTYY